MNVGVPRVKVVRGQDHAQRGGDPTYPTRQALLQSGHKSASCARFLATRHYQARNLGQFEINAMPWAEHASLGAHNQSVAAIGIVMPGSAHECDHRRSRGRPKCLNLAAGAATFSATQKRADMGMVSPVFPEHSSSNEPLREPRGLMLGRGGPARLR